MFNVKIYLEGGSIIEDLFEEFTVSKNAYGEVTEMSWKFAEEGKQMLRLKLDRVMAVISEPVDV